ncbi:MAG: hypothetical protein GWP09_02575 [Nitrospiraceae bacterium]|nr:hypothetical protein [Nitrospiraceae bacterium]
MKGNSKRYVGLATFVLLVLVVGVILDLTTTSCSQTVKPKQCNSNMSCFNESLKSCQPAVVVNTSRGMMGNFTVRFSVLGMNGSTCMFEMKYLKSPVPMFNGTSMICNVKDYKTGFNENSIGEWAQANECHGKLYDLMKSLMGNQ